MLRSNLRALVAEENIRRAYADEPDLTPVAIAADTGLAYSTVRRMYDNVAKSTSYETLYELVSYFQCEVGDLFYDDEEPESTGSDIVN